MFLTTKGLIIRETKYKESDKILTILTDTEGKITVSARGARSKKSKYAAATQLLTYSEITIAEYKGKWYLREANILEMFDSVRQDVELLSLGSYFAELLEAVSDEDNPNPEMLQLGLNSLYAISVLKKPQQLVKTVFEIRMMCLAGYTPQLSECNYCGNPNPAVPLFSTLDGILICNECKTEESNGIKMPLSEESLSAFRYIVNCHPKKIFSFTASEKAIKQLSMLSEVYVLTQLERGFQTLDFWKSFSKHK